jgi:hypothetical protein
MSKIGPYKGVSSLDLAQAIKTGDSPLARVGKGAISQLPKKVRDAIKDLSANKNITNVQTSTFEFKGKPYIAVDGIIENMVDNYYFFEKNGKPKGSQSIYSEPVQD